MIAIMRYGEIDQPMNNGCPEHDFKKADFVDYLSKQDLQDSKMNKMFFGPTSSILA